MWSKKFERCQNCKTTEIKHRANGLCKKCYKHFLYLKKRTNLEYMIRKKYNHMTTRSKKREWKICNFEEFFKFALQSEEFKKLRENWISSGLDRKLIPTIDRIDNDRGYSIDNMQFLTQSENSKKSHIEIPKGKKVMLVKNNEVLYFDSQSEASRYFGVSRNTVCRALKQNYRIKGYKPHRIE